MTSDFPGGGVAKFLDVDPKDPTRFLVQGEELFPFTKSNAFAVHTIAKGAPEMKEFERALQRFYEWYPCVRLKPELQPNDLYRYTEGQLRPIAFAEDVKNNKVIRTVDDFREIAAKTYTNAFHDKYTFGPQMYRVEARPGSTDSYINDKVGHIMFVPTHHLTMDGKSTKIVRNMINGYLKDRNFKPRIAEPQEALNIWSVLIPDGMEPRPVQTPPWEAVDTIGFEKNSKVDPLKRGLSIDVRRVQRSEVGRPAGHSLTVSLTATHAFLFTSLLLDYNAGQESVCADMSCPYTIDHDVFKNIVEGDYRWMMGVDMALSRTYQRTSRNAPKTLYEMVDITSKSHEYFRDNLTQMTVNDRYGPFISKDFPIHQKGFVNNLLSNLGRLDLLDGPIDTTSGFSLSTLVVGSVEVFLAGQMDGSVVVTATSHKTSYGPRFLKRYLDLFLKLSKLSEKRDVTRAELVKMPEYKELLSLIDK